MEAFVKRLAVQMVSIKPECPFSLVFTLSLLSQNYSQAAVPGDSFLITLWKYYGNIAILIFVSAFQWKSLMNINLKKEQLSPQFLL